MKKILMMVLSLVLVAALSIGGTVAYLQDTDEDVNVMTLGSVKIEQLEYERVVDADGKWVSTSTTDKYSYTPDKLQEYTQGKPLLPAVFADGTIKWDDRNGSQNASGAGSHQQSWGQVGASGSNQLFDDSVKNAQDKFVFVKNTGKSDAYVRTWIAFEQGDIAEADFKNVIMTNTDKDHWDWSDWTYGVAIDNVNYVVVCATYKGPSSNPTGILAPKAVSYPSLLQVYMTPAATNDDVEKIDGNNNGTYDIHVLSQAVQVDGFDSAAVALEAAFPKGTNNENIAKWFEGTAISTPEDKDDLKDDLQNQNAKTIVVNLTSDMTYDVAAWANDAMGGAETEEVIIYGNGHTITFEHKNSDWNNIVTNGAKLVINNAKITNTGYNDGPWNRHDLSFACEVELNNVTSDKALALKADATLKNVTINDANTSDTYAIWIQPKGQTINIDGLVIDMIACTDGRGIKIDNQYLNAAEEAAVTLNIKNATFDTEEKSAILVKTTKGATINAENLDISGVAADRTNAVWVDNAVPATADLVVVKGANKIVEP